MRLSCGERERRLLLADDGGADEGRGAGLWECVRHFAHRDGDELIACQRRHGFGRTDHQREVRSGFTKDAAFVEDPLECASGQADKRVLHDDAVVPEVHRDDRHGGHRRRVRDRTRESRRCGRKERPQSVPWDRADHLCRRDPLASDFDGGDAAIVRDHARERPGADLATGALDKGARRLGVHLVEWTRGKNQRGSFLVRAEHLPQHADEGCGGRLVDRLIESGDGERFPERGDEAVRLTVGAEPVEQAREVLSPCARPEGRAYGGHDGPDIPRRPDLQVGR